MPRKHDGLHSQRGRGEARRGCTRRGVGVRVDECGQRGDEAVDVGVGVRERDQRHEPAVVGELEVDPVVLAEPVGGGEAGEAEADDVEGTCVGSRAATPGVPRCRRLSGPSRQLPDRGAQAPRPVDRPAQDASPSRWNCRRAASIDDSSSDDALLDCWSWKTSASQDGIDPTALDAEHRRLGQPGQRLVHAADGEGAGLQRGRRQPASSTFCNSAGSTPWASCRRSS